MPETLTVPRGSDFAPLARQVRDSGLLDRRRGYYTLSIGLNLLGTAAIWIALAMLGDTWWQLLLAVPAAVLSARTGFLGHDSGHRQIARTARANRLLGLLLGNVMLGMSRGWWVDKHNRHHAHPNHVGKDPDVGAGALVWTPEQAGERRGATAWLARHQAALFFPMLLLEGLSLQITSVLDLRNRAGRERLVEGSLLAVHAIGYPVLAFAVLTPLQAVAFMALHQALFGLHLGCAFAPNHKGMEMPGEEEDWDHLRRQVLTSRNVRGGPVTDWLLGGLNYQIEHHLLPGIPRPNLRRAQPLVREHCARLGLPYAETGPLDSYALALGHLRAVGEPLRRQGQEEAVPRG
ncbi:acyl-CoA desaturase [Actinomadura craniellae]|uniref:Acyl-CoA desaturase n=1 Tax=Actinomadura craniellae TaxID=2231787 RepID=A0A365HB83_9ACTN|nr:acyl-CoA desaturase [Actinomadura craniellae]RAY16400.1 acyl-CoA desaturase [Actinomadura craniellae]